MKRIENQCCGCSAPGYPCMGESCPNRNVPVYYCDECGDGLEDIFRVDEKDLCENCLKQMFRVEPEEE